ncbi:MAG: biotin/lipoyl-binding protein [Bacteroides sp.]|nr:biotin/lipoyl-binding protein [Bacteroides sp.]
MNRRNRILAIAFVIVLIATLIFSLTGILLMGAKPQILQGQIEATEIKISGKLPGRIDRFLVKEGDYVRKGDTLVIINSPELFAKYRQVNALEEVARQQNNKVDRGANRHIIATAYQLWNKTQSDLELAEITYRRILALYQDSVVTPQRKDEVETLYKAAVAAERAAHEQYLLASEGAEKEDRAAARSLVDVARSTVDEVSALLSDAWLTAPEAGQIGSVYPKRGELVAPGTPLMNLLVTDDMYAVFNIREDLMPRFRVGGTFIADVPAVNRTGIEFEVYYISPMGSFATWKSTKQTGSYDLQTFEIHARPTTQVEDLRPGMSVLLTFD